MNIEEFKDAWINKIVGNDKSIVVVRERIDDKKEEISFLKASDSENVTNDNDNDNVAENEKWILLCGNRKER